MELFIALGFPIVLLVGLTLLFMTDGIPSWVQQFNRNSSTFCMGKFTTSKLIQNLGTRNEVYNFDGYFRSAHGRD